MIQTFWGGLITDVIDFLKVSNFEVAKSLM